jgi:hypothetical protein
VDSRFSQGAAPGNPTTSGATVPPSRFPERFSEAQLATELGLRITGASADGSALQSPTGGPLPRVVWVDAGSEVLVHLDSIKVSIGDRIILVSIDLESDQTGRTPLVSAFAVASPQDPAGMLMATDEYPRGNGILASRWGEAFTQAAWAALLDLLSDVAAERKLSPVGIVAVPGAAMFLAGNPILATGAAKQ